MLKSWDRIETLVRPRVGRTAVSQIDKPTLLNIITETINTGKVGPTSTLDQVGFFHMSHITILCISRISSARSTQVLPVYYFTFIIFLWDNHSCRPR